MSKYVCNDTKIVSIGDDTGINIPEPIASIKFDAIYAGTYIVDVQQDGSYLITFVGETYKYK